MIKKYKIEFNYIGPKTGDIYYKIKIFENNKWTDLVEESFTKSRAEKIIKEIIDAEKEYTITTNSTIEISQNRISKLNF